jgi:antitoxin component YwqK of YwqJK toxin-antitoxin module
MKALLSLFFTVIASVLLAQNVTDAKGLKQGPWSKKYLGTSIYEYKGQFKDNLPVGTFTYYYKNTKIKAIIKHGEGAKRSEAIFYHDNGVIMSKGIYLNLKKDSIWQNYGPSGKLSNLETYKNDKLEGKKVIYYVPENPSVKTQIVLSELQYKGGKLNGQALHYFDNGSIKEKGSYIEDRKVGIWETYHFNGRKSGLQRFKNGIKHGWCFVYDETGKELGRSYFYYGKRLTGKALEDKLAQMKKLGIDPNN